MTFLLPGNSTSLADVSSSSIANQQNNFKPQYIEELLLMISGLRFERVKVFFATWWFSMLVNMAKIHKGKKRLFFSSTLKPKKTLIWLDLLHVDAQRCRLHRVHHKRLPSALGDPMAVDGPFASQTLSSFESFQKGAKYRNKQPHIVGISR